MEHIEYSEMSLLLALKTASHVLRKQLVFVFLFEWIAVFLAMIPSVDSNGVVTTKVSLLFWIAISFKAF